MPVVIQQGGMKTTQYLMQIVREEPEKLWTSHMILDFVPADEVVLARGLTPQNVNTAMKILIAREVQPFFEERWVTKEERRRGPNTVRAIRYLPPDAENLDQEDFEEEQDDEDVKEILEKDLHPLANFVIHKVLDAGAMTIPHQQGGRRRKGVGKWIYPDMVGLNDPRTKIHSAKIKEKSLLGNVSFSFEIKPTLTNSSYREAVFQTIANSSWANYTYLVVGWIDQSDNELIRDLRALATKHKFGVLTLISPNRKVNQENVLITAPRTEFDAYTADLLAKQSPKFENDYLEQLFQTQIVWRNFDFLPKDNPAAMSELEDELEELVANFLDQNDV